MGTGAHALCEDSLRRNSLGISEDRIGEEFMFEYNRMPTFLTIDEDMREHCNVYIRRIHDLAVAFDGCSVTVEERIDFKHVHANMTRGKADTVLRQICTGLGKLIVSDFKFGIAPVKLVHSPEYLPDFDAAGINPQLLIYAAGIAHADLWLYDKVQLEIVQPRAFEVPAIQSIIVPIDWLQKWAETTLVAATVQTESPVAPLVPGDYCKQCPARAQCPALMEQAQIVAGTEFQKFAPDAKPLPDVRLLNKDQIIRVLEWASVLDNWLRQVNSAAYQMLQRGETLPGFKLVTGKGRREWADPSIDGMLKLFTAELTGVSEDIDSDLHQLLTPVEMRSPAQVEKLGKRFKEIVKKLARKVPGEPTLAIESDRRPAIKPSFITEFSDFTS